MILGPLSIATGGYIGIGPGAGDYCPLPLAIGSDGYIRFEIEPTFVEKGGAGKGRTRWIEPPYYPPVEPEPKKNMAKLALLAIIAIEAHYDD